MRGDAVPGRAAVATAAGAGATAATEGAGGLEVALGAPPSGAERSGSGADDGGASDGAGVGVSAVARGGGTGADVSVLERFAERYQGTNLGERALVDAFVAARAVGDNDALQRLGGRRVQQYPDSEQTSGIISSLARNAVANLDYEQAIAAFEKAAATEASDSAMLLVTAAELKDQLGDAAGATEVFKQALARGFVARRFDGDGESRRYTGESVSKRGRFIGV